MTSIVRFTITALAITVVGSTPGGVGENAPLTELPLLTLSFPVTRISAPGNVGKRQKGLR